MYSRDFSDSRPLPPEYSGTALGQGRRSEPPDEEVREAHHTAPPEEGGCDAERKTAPPSREESRGGILPLFERLLPKGVDPGDLLLLGVALLLLLDGCEDELLPLLLLFLLVIH